MDLIFTGVPAGGDVVGELVGVDVGTLPVQAVPLRANPDDTARDGVLLVT